MSRCGQGLRKGVSILLLGVGLPLTSQAASCSPPAWPLWHDFVEHFIQADGRVLDASTPQQHSSSEGQSYAMFFALVAGDEKTFDKLWHWSHDNLFASDLPNRLPAWFWGKNEQGGWGVLDDNSASDADLWFAYALLEAARVWQRPELQAQAITLLKNIEAQELAELPGLGTMLLPGFRDFAKPEHLWQLNPSYLPIPILHRLHGVSAQAGWQAVAQNTVSMLQAIAPHGVVADWVSYRGVAPASGLFIIDPVKGDRGSYDAIRTYMWAGMMADGDPLKQPALQALSGMSRLTAASGLPPENITVADGRAQGNGPFGFSAALIPYFQALGQTWLADLQQRRVDAALIQSLQPEQLQGRQPPYYDYVLSLFALGWSQHRYRFQEDGTVQLFWETTCPRSAVR